MKKALLIIAGGLLLATSCSKHFHPSYPARTEDDFVFIYECQTYLYHDYIKKFKKKPPDSLLLRYHPNFRDSCAKKS